MKIKIVCEIEAEIIDKEEVEAIKELSVSGKANFLASRFFTRSLKEKLKEFLPNSTYDEVNIIATAEYKED